ncbi:hypothetical protein HHK36_014483 [Tetracentron sinense]|uniref:Uncharacterized protein n=1 Tax=Tetracentron sinense TaxID=13715 RepID=A0A835DIC9_TETSI|nr:hypothetical protein HHK36_014483 [Tetracentron sinense]
MTELRQHDEHAANARSKKKGHGFTRRCTSLVKQQRARIYILRRCATMLLCCISEAPMVLTMAESLPQMLTNTWTSSLTCHSLKIRALRGSLVNIVDMPVALLAGLNNLTSSEFRPLSVVTSVEAYLKFSIKSVDSVCFMSLEFTKFGSTLIYLYNMEDRLHAVSSGALWLEKLNVAALSGESVTLSKLRFFIFLLACKFHLLVFAKFIPLLQLLIFSRFLRLLKAFIPSKFHILLRIQLIGIGVGCISSGALWLEKLNVASLSGESVTLSKLRFHIFVGLKFHILLRIQLIGIGVGCISSGALWLEKLTVVALSGKSVTLSKLRFSYFCWPQVPFTAKNSINWRWGWLHMFRPSTGGVTPATVTATELSKV